MNTRNPLTRWRQRATMDAHRAEPAHPAKGTTMTDSDTMKSYRLDRDGEIPIEFTGVLLGEASSAAPGKTAWTVHRIYRTEKGRYVAATWRGKHSGLDMGRIVAVDRPEQIPDGLRQTRKGLSYQTKVALDAMEAAAAVDPAIAAAVIERV